MSVIPGGMDCQSRFEFKAIQVYIVGTLRKKVRKKEMKKKKTGVVVEAFSLTHRQRQVEFVSSSLVWSTQ